MTKRSANRRKGAGRRRGLLRAGLAAAGEALARNPGLAGGATAFAVTFLFVSANALWYQPHAHGNAFFETRERLARPAAADDRENETVILIEREEPAGDPAVEQVQSALNRLDLYAGEVDGIAGPLTREAVKQYQQIAGIEVSGEIDDELLARLVEGLDTRPAVAAQPQADATPAVELPQAAPIPPLTPPDPAPIPASYQPVEETASVRASAPAPQPAAAQEPPARLTSGDPQVVRIQAGLRAFGNDAILVDGVAGAQTRAAIREFQSLFGLPVTGEPDDALFAKMQEIGLTN